MLREARRRYDTPANRAKLRQMVSDLRSQGPRSQRYP
jgi:hypothetical protein